MKHPLPTYATRIYNLLLRLYPRHYQNLFGAQMQQTFLDHYQDVAASAGGVSLQFWLSLFADEIPNIARQHRDSLLERNAFLNFTCSKLMLAVMLCPPLYLLFYMVIVNIVLALPHPHVHGLTALFALAFLLLIPALVTLVVSYFLASVFVSALGKVRRTLA